MTNIHCTATLLNAGMDSGAWGALGTWFSIIPAILALYLLWRDKEKGKLIATLQEHQMEMARQTNQLSGQVAGLEKIQQTLASGVAIMTQTAGVETQMRIASIKPRLEHEGSRVMTDPTECLHRLINKGAVARDFSYTAIDLGNLMVRQLPTHVERDEEFALQLWSLGQMISSHSLELKYKDQDGNEYKQTLSYNESTDAKLTEPLLTMRAGV